jgi:dolichol kinase
MEDNFAFIGIIVFCIVVFLWVRSWLIDKKREMRNTFTAIVENEPVEQIEMEADAERMVNRMIKRATKSSEKKSRGGVVKVLVWIGIIIAILCIIGNM